MSVLNEHTDAYIKEVAWIIQMDHYRPITTVFETYLERWAVRYIYGLRSNVDRITTTPDKLANILGNFGAERRERPTRLIRHPVAIILDHISGRPKFRL
jgi:hypothetical protein